MSVGLIITKITAFIVQRILQISSKRHLLRGMVFLKNRKSDSRFLRSGKPVALVWIKNMPEKILSELNTGRFLHCFIGFGNKSGHRTDRLWIFRIDHSTTQYFKIESITIIDRHLFNNRAESITPATIRI